MHYHLVKLNQDIDSLQEIYGDQSSITELVKSVGEQLFNPDMQQMATDNLHESGLRFNPLYANAVSRIVRPIFGYKTDETLFPNFLESIIIGKNRQLAAILSHNEIRDFERRHQKDSNPQRVEAWANYMRWHLMQSHGAPSYLPDSALSNPEFKTDSLMRRLSDKYYVDKSKDKPRTLLNLPIYADFQARYDLMSLLFHPKVWMGNMLGGSINSIVNTGSRYWLRAGQVKYLQTVNRDWKTWTDVVSFVKKHGVHETSLSQELGSHNIVDHSIRERLLYRKKIGGKITLADRIEIAQSTNTSEKIVRGAAWFIQHSEQQLRVRSFMAHYLKARDMFAGNGFRPSVDDPVLIHIANTGVSGTQYLYDNAARPIAAQTNMGKIFFRFKLWVGNSLRFTGDVFDEAKRAGYDETTPEFERLERYVLAMTFMTALAACFPSLSSTPLSRHQPIRWQNLPAWCSVTKTIGTTVSMATGVMVWRVVYGLQAGLLSQEYQRHSLPQW